MRTKLILGVSALLVLANGIVHGLVTHRWTKPVSLKALGDTLEQVPLQCGDWQGKRSDVDPVVLRAAEAAGAFQATFINNATGEMTNVLLLCGRPGPMSVHMPEYCYAGFGYRTEGDPTVVTVPGKGGKELTFRKIRMVRETSEGVPEEIIVYHSWYDGSGWSAPKLPRLVFATAPFLYKLYITTLPEPVGAIGEDPCLDFAKEFCPLVEKAAESLGQ